MYTIYIGFTDSTLWTKHFLKKGFAHCCILLSLDAGWLEIDPTNKILQFKLRTDAEISKFTKLLRVEIKDFKFKGFPLKFLTCVNVVEYALGKNIYAITPYRLYRKLTGKLKEIFNTKEIL